MPPDALIGDDPFPLASEIPPAETVPATEPDDDDWRAYDNWLRGDLPPVTPQKSAAVNGRDKTSPRRFVLLDASDLPLNLRAAYLVRDLIPAQGLTIVWGPPKSGKSFWILDIAFHVALGREYRGHRVKQGLVVYVGCEGGFSIPARIEAFRQDKIRGPIPAGIFKPLLTRLDLVNERDQLIADIKEQVGETAPALIVIDTLNRTLVGSESSDEDMSAYVQAADKIRETFECAVAIVHHCGHDQSRPRGHTSLMGAADAQIAVKRSADNLITTEVEFMKDGAEGTTTTSRFKVVANLSTDEDGEPISSSVLDPVEAQPKPVPKSGPKVKPPSPMSVKFYDALANAAAVIAKPRAEAGNRPSITENEWIAELIRQRLVHPDPPDADKATKRTAQNRRTALVSKYRSELIAAQWIACSGPVLWSIRKAPE